MSEPRNHLTINSLERQRMGKNGSFRDARVKGGEMAPQMSPPGLPTPSPFPERPPGWGLAVGGSSEEPQDRRIEGRC